MQTVEQERKKVVHASLSTSFGFFICVAIVADI